MNSRSNRACYGTLAAFLFLASTLLFAGCGSSEDKEETYMGSLIRSDLCELLQESDVREVYELADTVEIEQKPKAHGNGLYICSYEWTDPASAGVFHFSALNFSGVGKVSSSEANEVWETQNDRIYNDHGLQSVENVGSKASWSTLGGGQLRVYAKKYIFFVEASRMVITEGDVPPFTTEEKIAIASELAQRIIDRM